MNTMLTVLLNLRNVASFAWHLAGYAVGYLFLLLRPKASLAAEALALRSQQALWKHDFDSGERELGARMAVGYGAGSGSFCAFIVGSTYAWVGADADDVTTLGVAADVRAGIALRFGYRRPDAWREVPADPRRVPAEHYEKARRLLEDIEVPEPRPDARDEGAPQ